MALLAPPWGPPIVHRPRLYLKYNILLFCNRDFLFYIIYCKITPNNYIFLYSMCKCNYQSCYNSTRPGSSDGRLGADLHAFLARVTPDGDPAVSADACTDCTSSPLPRTAPHSLSAPLAGQTGHQLMRGRGSGAGHGTLSSWSAGGNLPQTSRWQIEPDQLCGDHLHEQEPGNRVMCGGDRYVGYKCITNRNVFSCF